MTVARKIARRTHIGPYQILAKIGEGGMGTVYLTKMDGPAGFNKLAVVKELRADLTGSSALVEMFLNEARLAARLTHPNVVHTYGANEENGSLYLAMEYLDGQPWSRIRHALWQRGSLPFGLHVKVLAEILAGLQYAHELRDYDGTPLQVVHCDVSPQNVFVTYDGQVKVVDFGVARAASGEKKSGTQLLIGKLAYIAPEQARGEELDRRADVFAVGVMLWELLAGKRFAEGDDFRAMRERRAIGAEPRIREVVPNAPEKLADICDRALALDPAARYATAGEFREALLTYVAEDVQDLDHVQLGELVVSVFEEERARVHALIEKNLKPASTLQSSIEDLVQRLHGEPGEYTLKADLSELASVSRLSDDAALISASHSASIRVEHRVPRAVLYIGAAAALALTGAWLGTRGAGPRGASSPLTAAARVDAAVAPLPPKPAPAPLPLMATEPERARAELAPQTVLLSVSALPSEANLLLDGVPLHGNPYSERVRADGELHLLRASGAGLQSQERVIVFDRDRSVTFRLAGRGAVAARAVARAPSHRAEPANTSALSAPPEPPPSAAAPRARREPEYDIALTPNTAPREIYVEDPYR
jgi:serine/threonine-protein kinase